MCKLYTIRKREVKDKDLFTTVLAMNTNPLLKFPKRTAIYLHHPDFAIQRRKTIFHTILHFVTSQSYETKQGRKQTTKYKYTNGSLNL